MNHKGAGARQALVLLASLALAAGLLLCGCDDAIPVAETRPANLVASADSTELGLAPTHREEALQAAVELSISARALYAALGRSGNREADDAVPPWISELQRAALEPLRKVFLDRLRHLLIYLNQRAPDENELWRSKLEDFSGAAEHIAASIERRILTGSTDRIHPLYIDRLDRLLVETHCLDKVWSPCSGTTAAFELWHYFLNHLEAGIRLSCVELQCAGYGVFAPLSESARAELLVPTALVMSIEPAMRSWWRWLDLNEADRQFALAASQVAFTAASHLAQHNLALVSGIDEFARRAYLVFHRPQWPFNSLTLVRLLLAQYQRSIETTN